MGASRKYYAICEECGLVVEAERADVGVAIVGLYDHCGWAHDCNSDELFTSKRRALEAAAAACDQDALDNQLPPV